MSGMHWSEKLERLLRQKKWKRPRLAEESGVPYSTIKHWGAATEEPGVVSGVKVAQSLGVDPIWLFTDAEWPPSPESSGEIAQELSPSFQRTILELVSGAIKQAAQQYGGHRVPIVQRDEKSRPPRR